MKKRYHIQDTISATIEEYGNSVELTDEDVKGIVDSVKGKTEIVSEYVFKDVEYGVAVQVLRNNHAKQMKSLQKASAGFDWTKDIWNNLGGGSKVEESIRFDMIFHHKKTGNYGKATYAVYRTSKGGKWRLSYIGNPTTLINGHNSGPVVLKDKPGFMENMELNRVGFNFFFMVLKYTPSDIVANIVKNGLISLQNSQIAIYVPSKDKNRDLTVLKILYCRPLIGDVLKDGRYPLAGELMGLKPVISTDEGMTGIMLRGYSGKNNPTFTLNFYDKALSNKAKRKRGVSTTIRETLDNSLRVDITLHRRMIDMLASQALTIVKTRVNKLISAGKNVNRWYSLFIEQMEKGNTSSALVMCMIMHVLPAKEPFASFLLRRIIVDELMLDKIVKVSNNQLTINKDQVSSDIYTIYRTWVSAKTIDQWKIKKTELRASFKDSTREFYRNINTLEEMLGISLEVPYTFWVQTAALDGLYGLTTKEVEFIAECNSMQPSNNEEQDKERALKYMRLMQKGRQKSLKRRKHSIKTFLAPIGLGE